MKEVDRSKLTAVGLAVCDELSQRPFGSPGRLDSEYGYQGDTFLEVAAYLIPDILEPGNHVSDEVLAFRLHTVSEFLSDLAARGEMDAEVIDSLLAAVDFTSIGGLPAAEAGALPDPAQPALFPLVLTNLSA